MKSRRTAGSGSAPPRRPSAAPGALCFAAIGALGLAGLLGACGTSDDNQVEQPAPEFVYVGNSVDSTISGYAVNPATGALTAVAGSPFAGPASVNRLAAHPSGAYLFAAPAGGSSLSVYAIDPATGMLSETAASPANIGQAVEAMAVHPSGDYVLVSLDTPSDILTVLTFDAANGTVKKTAPGNPHSTGFDPFGIGMDSKGNFIYTANNGDGISGFTMIPGSGALGVIIGSPFVYGTQPRDIAIDPADRFAYMADDFDVYGFFFNSATGALAPTTPASYVLPTGTAIVRIEPAGRYVYFLEGGTKLYKFDIGSDGALGNLKSYTAGASALGMDVSPSGSFLFTTDAAGDAVTAWAINPATGALTKVTGSPFVTGGGPRPVAVARVRE